MTAPYYTIALFLTIFSFRYDPSRADDVPAVRTLMGHSGLIMSVAFSPDGKTVASGVGGRVKLWRYQARAPGLPRILIGHSDAVQAGAFSSDGKTLASGSRDATVTLWDAPTGTLKANLSGAGGLSVAFSPDGKTLATGGFGFEGVQTLGEVSLWNGQTGAFQQALAGHEHRVNSVVFSPDGKTLASASKDKTVRLWHVPTGDGKRTLTGYESGVLCVAFSPDGLVLASGCEDGTMWLWRME